MAKGLTVKVRADASQFTKTMRGVKSSLGALSGPMKIAGITAAAAGASILALGYGISRMMKSASQEAAGFETLSTQLEVLTGSAANAKKLLDELTEFGATTPLEQGDLQQASKTLLGFGIELKNIMPTLKMLGDVSMGDGQKLQQLALVFGQISSAGRLMGGDVLQLINAGFNPLVQISKRTGESMLDLKKRMEDGAISADEVTQAFRDATSEGGLFNGMLAKVADTTQGKISNLSDNIAKLKRDFGIGFNEGLKVALDATNEMLPKLENAFKIAGEVVGSTLTAAVQGDFKKLAALGEAIGEVIRAGFKMATAGIGNDLLAKIMESFSGGIIADMTGIDIFKGQAELARSRAAAARFEAKNQTPRDLQAGLAKLVDVATQPTGEVQGAFGGRFRYAGPGEQSIYKDEQGRALIEIKDGINRLVENSNPSLFPSR